MRIAWEWGLLCWLMACVCACDRADGMRMSAALAGSGGAAGDSPAERAGGGRGVDWGMAAGAGTSASASATETDRDGGEPEQTAELPDVHVYLAGDSTVSTYTSNFAPQAGWGQLLPEFFADQASVDNRAIGGRTAQRFITEKRLDELLGSIHAGDYLLVQFGTNDSNRTATYSDGTPYYAAPADFETYLAQYVTGARDHRAVPVLVTPPPRRSCDTSDDRRPFGNGLAAYAAAMHDVATAMHVAIIDLNQKTLDYLNSIGCAASADFFLNAAAGEYSGAYAKGISDATHFQTRGARKLAEFIADGIRENDLPLARYLK